MKSDREILVLAARSAGVRGTYFWNIDDSGIEMPGGRVWNPRSNDGDCARLEALLRIDIEWQRIGVVACHRAENGHDIVARVTYADHYDDRPSARRMASLMVAAAIQEAKEAP
jgi:hypothetical protein